MGHLEVGRQVLEHRLEHGAIQHIVAVEDEVLPLCLRLVSPVQKRRAATGGIAIKVPPEVVFRFFRCPHHGVIHRRVWDGEPAHTVGFSLCRAARSWRGGAVVKVTIVSWVVDDCSGESFSAKDRLGDSTSRKSSAKVS